MFLLAFMVFQSQDLVVKQLCVSHLLAQAAKDSKYHIGTQWRTGIEK